MGNLKEAEKLMNKLGFDKVDKDFINNIVGETPMLPTAISNLASANFSKSLACFTKWLTIFTAILSVSTVIQIYITFCPGR
jgi:hypothetical protein